MPKPLLPSITAFPNIFSTFSRIHTTHSASSLGRTHLCEVFDIQFLDWCRCCQEYGHHANTCISIPRCGNCADRHNAKVCRSFFINASCAKSRAELVRHCRGKKARRVDKLNARFPLEYCPSASAFPSKEPEAATPTVDSSRIDLSAPQIPQMETTHDGPSKLSSIPARSSFSSALTPSAQQLQDNFPIIERS